MTKLILTPDPALSLTWLRLADCTVWVLCRIDPVTIGTLRLHGDLAGPNDFEFEDPALFDDPVNEEDYCLRGTFACSVVHTADSECETF